MAASCRAVRALVVVLVAGAVLAAAPAPTVAAPSSEANGLYVASDPLNDVSPTANFGAADIHFYSVDFSTRAAVFGATVRIGTDPLSSNWQDGQTVVDWFVDSDDDGPYDWEVAFFNDGADHVLATVYDLQQAAPVPVCQGEPRWDGNTGYFATIATACIGSPTELRFSTGFSYDTDPGHPGTALEKDFGPDTNRTPTITAHDVPPIGPFLTVGEFVEQQYQDFLGRAADGNGFAFWSSALNSGEETPAQMIESFLLSAEFGQIAAPVTRLYAAAFLRIPDYGGLTFWIAQGRAGDSLSHIADNFAESAEFQDLYGDIGNDEFVATVYDNVLGRPPDADGEEYWTEQLNSGAITRGGMMLGFSESEEYVTAQFAETYTVLAFTGMLRRTPDPDGYAYWVDQLDGGVPIRDLVGSFLYSDEYAARFA